MSGSFESVQWNACVHRLDLSLYYSHPKEFWGNGIRTHVNSTKQILLRGGSNPQNYITQDSEPNTLPAELFRPIDNSNSEYFSISLFPHPHSTPSLLGLTHPHCTPSPQTCKPVYAHTRTQANMQTSICTYKNADKDSAVKKLPTQASLSTGLGSRNCGKYFQKT